MLGHDFYHGLIQKHVVIFGTLFNDFKITRFDKDKNAVQVSRVPLNYGPKEAWMARTESDPEINRPVAITLPRMAYEMIDVRYAGDRKLSTTQSYSGRITTAPSDKVALNRVDMPVPYDITFKLTVMTKTAEDGMKIIEQIVPYFTPDWTVTAELLESLPGYKIDIPITLASLEYSDNYDAAFEKRRMITWDLTFVMKAYLFGPVSSAKIIKVAKVNFYANGVGDKTVDERLVVRPGLTADGHPTSNADLSVPVSQIEEDDDYGYIVTIENTSYEQ